MGLDDEFEVGRSAPERSPSPVDSLFGDYEDLPQDYIETRNFFPVCHDDDDLPPEPLPFEEDPPWKLEVSEYTVTSPATINFPSSPDINSAPSLSANKDLECLNQLLNQKAQITDDESENNFKELCEDNDASIPPYSRPYQSALLSAVSGAVNDTEKLLRDLSVDGGNSRFADLDPDSSFLLSATAPEPEINANPETNHAAPRSGAGQKSLDDPDAQAAQRFHVATDHATPNSWNLPPREDLANLDSDGIYDRGAAALGMVMEVENQMMTNSLIPVGKETQSMTEGAGISNILPMGNGWPTQLPLSRNPNSISNFTTQTQMLDNQKSTMGNLYNSLPPWTYPYPQSSTQTRTGRSSDVPIPPPVNKIQQPIRQVSPMVAQQRGSRFQGPPPQTSTAQNQNIMVDQGFRHVTGSNPQFVDSAPSVHGQNGIDLSTQQIQQAVISACIPLPVHVGNGMGLRTQQIQHIQPQTADTVSIPPPVHGFSQSSFPSKKRKFSPESPCDMNKNIKRSRYDKGEALVRMGVQPDTPVQEAHFRVQKIYEGKLYCYLRY